MHELVLSHRMVELIEREARLQKFQRVETIRLEIGALSCVEPEALRFCFDTVTHGTVAEGARLEITTVPGDGWCPDCRARHPVRRWGQACPECGGVLMEARGGTQMHIKDLEVH